MVDDQEWNARINQCIRNNSLNDVLYTVVQAATYALLFPLLDLWGLIIPMWLIVPYGVLSSALLGANLSEIDSAELRDPERSSEDRQTPKRGCAYGVLCFCLTILFCSLARTYLSA